MGWKNQFKIHNFSIPKGFRFGYVYINEWLIKNYQLEISYIRHLEKYPDGTNEIKYIGVVYSNMDEFFDNERTFDVEPYLLEDTAMCNTFTEALYLALGMALEYINCDTKQREDF